ncbi:DUF484 family protein [Ideonella sp. TBM-1]|uniref:DUF484 family protein n=1 Tax=Ideonella livida TaxID=2707176 RepID=A0A7C9TLL3_9BURK|nr:DUF484 family protein [Ideonella livida]
MQGALAGITETDIAHYLAATPEFFERHAGLLASLQLVSPHSHRTVSLQERQMELLRERIKGLERKIMDMIRAGQENMVLSDRMHRWTRALMLARSASLLGQVLIEQLRHEFMVPQVALRVWRYAPEHAHLPWAQPVSEDLKTFAASLSQPYCGANMDFEAARWFEDGGEHTQSMAMVPLRLGRAGGECYGLLVLGSPDVTRYQADMGVEFLEQLGEIASAALGRLMVSERAALQPQDPERPSGFTPSRLPVLQAVDLSDGPSL